AERAAALRLRAAPLACFESDFFDAADRPCRASTRVAARARLRETWRRPWLRPPATSRAALRPTATVVKRTATMTAVRRRRTLVLHPEAPSHSQLPGGRDDRILLLRGIRPPRVRRPTRRPGRAGPRAALAAAAGRPPTPETRRLPRSRRARALGTRAGPWGPPRSRRTHS